MPNDDVIHHFDLEDLGGLDEPSRHTHVGFGWLRFTTRVIVQTDDGKRRAHDRDAENITGMDVAFIQCSGAHEVMSANAEFRVKAQDDEAFTLGIEEGVLLDMEPPVVGGFLGCVTMPQVFRSRTLAHGYQLPLTRRAIFTLVEIGCFHATLWMAVRPR